MSFSTQHCIVSHQPGQSVNSLCISITPGAVKILYRILPISCFRCILSWRATRVRHLQCHNLSFLVNYGREFGLPSKLMLIVEDLFLRLPNCIHEQQRAKAQWCVTSLNVSIMNIKTKAWEQKMKTKRHIRIHAGGENKIVIDESVGGVIYVQTRYIDMQKRVGWALAHLCPSQHAQHACHFFFAAAHGLHVRVHTHWHTHAHTHTNILTHKHIHTYLLSTPHNIGNMPANSLHQRLCVGFQLMVPIASQRQPNFKVVMLDW